MKIRKQLKTTMSLAAAMGTLGLLAAPLQAATVVGVTIEDVSSEFGDRLAVDTINGAGFDEANGFHSTADSEMWLNTGTFSGGTDPLPSHITYDLEANYDLSSLKIWNYNGAVGASDTAGAKDLEILVASSVGGSFTSISNEILAKGTGSTTTDFGHFVDLSSFAAADNVRLVRFNITSNQGFDFDLVGLSEVRFDGVAVPEPSTTALLGLGGLALILRRRK
jgi:hypothetical protein